MKLLLTSAGLSNTSISQALFNLVGKDPKDTVVTFIPTAMNVEDGDKGWFVDDLKNIQKQGIKELEIADISAVPQEVWLPRLEKADVLFFEGGNSTHLMRWIEQSGLKDRIGELLKTRVYVGVSAGSMVTNPTLFLSDNDSKIYYENTFGYTNKEALGLVDFYTRPHLGSPYFLQASAEHIEKLAQESDAPVYALDDDSAVQVVDGEIEVISEGEWKKY